MNNHPHQLLHHRWGDSSRMSDAISQMQYQMNKDLLDILQRYDWFLKSPKHHWCDLYTYSSADLWIRIHLVKPLSWYLTRDVLCYPPHSSNIWADCYVHMTICDTSVEYSPMRFSDSMYQIHKKLVECYSHPVYDIRHRKVSQESPIRGHQIVQCV